MCCFVYNVYTSSNNVRDKPRIKSEAFDCLLNKSQRVYYYVDYFRILMNELEMNWIKLFMCDCICIKRESSVVWWYLLYWNVFLILILFYISRCLLAGRCYHPFKAFFSHSHDNSIYMRILYRNTNNKKNTNRIKK